jgi:hypothetical protein
MDLSIRVAFSAIDKLTRPVSAASKAIGGLSDSLKQTQGSIKEVERQSAAFNRLRDSVKNLPHYRRHHPHAGRTEAGPAVRCDADG